MHYFKAKATPVPPKAISSEMSVDIGEHSDIEKDVQSEKPASSEQLKPTNKSETVA